MYDFIWAVFVYSPTEIVNLPFSKVCVFRLAQLLAKMSNAFAVLPLRGTHEQENKKRQDAVKRIYCFYLITARLIPAISTECLMEAYDDVKKVLITHIMKYFVKVPQVTVDGERVDFRCAKTHQHISPIGFILPLFVEL